MTRYTMDDGTIVDIDKASESWDEDQYFDGNNMISHATGSQWEHEKLYRSRKGRYYLESWSQRSQGSGAAEWLEHDQAAHWLLANGHELPEELKHLEEEIVE